MATLDEWTATAAGELGVDGLTPEQQALVLDVAREVAHNVLRPGAPLTAFLLGVAVGRGADLSTAAAGIIDLSRADTDS